MNKKLIEYTHIHTHTHTHTYIYIYIYIYTYIMVRVFANGPRDLCSIPGRVIPKTQKMVLDATMLNTQHYKVRIKGKVEQSRERSSAPPIPWCSSYRKGSFRVTLNDSHQLYLLNIYIYIYIYIYKIWFNGISAFHCYLMPNGVYAYIIFRLG